MCFIGFAGTDLFCGIAPESELLEVDEIVAAPGFQHLEANVSHFGRRRRKLEILALLQILPVIARDLAYGESRGLERLTIQQFGPTLPSTIGRRCVGAAPYLPAFEVAALVSIILSEKVIELVTAQFWPFAPCRK